MNWFLMAVRKYAVFSGRARRKEYWFFVLFYILIAVVLSFIDAVLSAYEEGIGMLTGIFQLAMFLPALGVAVRRMHDTGRSGWWVLVPLIPLIGGALIGWLAVLGDAAEIMLVVLGVLVTLFMFIGWLIFLWFATRDGQPGENAYGPDPKALPEPGQG